MSCGPFRFRLNLGIKIVQHSSDSIDREHGLRIGQQHLIRMRDARPIAQRVNGIENRRQGAEDANDLFGARAEVLKSRMVFSNHLEQLSQAGVSVTLDSSLRAQRPNVAMNRRMIRSTA